MLEQTYKVYSTKKANIAFALAKPKSKKGHNSVKSMQMISEFEPNLYFMILCPSVKFERNCYIPSKVIDRKLQIDNLAKI